MKQDYNKKNRAYKTLHAEKQRWRKRGKKIRDSIENVVLPELFKVKRQLRSVRNGKKVVEKNNTNS